MKQMITEYMQRLAVTLQGISVWNAVGLLAKQRAETGSFDTKMGLDAQKNKVNVLYDKIYDTKRV